MSESQFHFVREIDATKPAEAPPPIEKKPIVASQERRSFGSDEENDKDKKAPLEIAQVNSLRALVHFLLLVLFCFTLTSALRIYI